MRNAGRVEHRQALTSGSTRAPGLPPSVVNLAGGDVPVVRNRSTHAIVLIDLGTSDPASLCLSNQDVASFGLPRAVLRARI